MPSPIEIELRMDGSVTRAMQLVSPITILLFLKTLYAPSMLTLTCDPTHPKRSTLRISYEYLPDLINELRT
jgi:hypothetical protein